MSKARTFLAVCSLASLLLVLAGCGSDSADESQGDQADPGAAGASAPGGTNLLAPGALGANSLPQDPMVRVKTSLGEFTVKLDTEKAELTVDNFLRYVEKGYYDNTIFHQVLKDYVILGGNFTPEMNEKEATGTIRNEAFKASANRRGTIAMARQADVIDSAASQFFINLVDNPMLDHKSQDDPQQYGYCVFGEVIEGMEVVDKISNVEVRDEGEFERKPVRTVMIESVERIR